MTNQQGAPEAPKSTALDGKTELFHVSGYPLLVRAVDFNRLYAENAALQQGYNAARLEIDHLRGATKSTLLAQPVAWLVYLPSIDTQHLYYSQEDMGYVDDVTNHADAEVTPLYEMAAPKAEVAPAGEYPPSVAYTELPDFDTVEQRIYAGCRRFISGDMLEPIHGLIREAIDADRASRGQAPAPAAVAGRCEDAIELLGKYKELCEEIKRGDSYHLGRIDSAISVLAQTAPQPFPTAQADSQPAPTYKDSTPELHVGDSAFESWYSTYNPAHKSDKQRARDAYAAGMGDPLVMAAPVAQGDAEDAARYRFLAGHCRSTSEHWGGRWSIIVDGPAPKSHDSEDDFDEAVDAARKKGENHD